MKTDKKPIAVGLGEVLWDVLPEGRRLGGAPTNFVYHSNAMGATGIVVSAIGDDVDGCEIRNRLSELGIETGHLGVVKDHPTGTVSVKLSPSGQASYIIHEPVAWDYIQWSDELAGLAVSCDAVCFGSLAQRNRVSRENIQRFLSGTSADCLRVFDVNVRQDYAKSETVRQSLQLSNILKLNDEELPLVKGMLGLGENNESKLIKEMLSLYDLSCVILTKGAQGSILYTPNEVSFQKGTDVAVVDTVGAGDSFTAAVVMGLLQRLPLKKLHERAARIGEYVCTQPGATPPLPSSLIG